MVCIHWLKQQGRRGHCDSVENRPDNSFSFERQPSMSEYPANSAGDLFRLLPFEGYMGVLASLPVRWLQKAAQLSKGWHFAVACTPTKCDRSITCKSIGDLTNFLRSLPQSEFVSAICCDVVALSGNTVQYHFDDEPSKAAQIRQILQLTWRCSQFWEYRSCTLYS